MSDTSLTSIIMVSYHTGSVIEQAISAVLELKEPLELVLVNNGNPKEVEDDFLKRFKDDPKVRYVTGHGNIGFGRACNLGVRMSKGDRILLLNPDCILSNDVIRHLSQQEKGLKTPFILGARLVDDNGVEQAGDRRAILTPITSFVEFFGLSKFFPKYRFNFNKDPVPKEKIEVPAISGAFMYMKKKHFQKIRGFDGGYFLHVEDLDLCLRFKNYGGKIYFLPNLVVTHVGAASKVGAKFVEKQKAISFSRYFHENFASQYPYVLLWLLDIMIWTRYLIKVHIIPKIYGVLEVAYRKKK